MRTIQVDATHVQVTGNCVFTGKPYTTAPFRKSGLRAWQKGGLIQNAIPDLNAGDREFLISGISPEGWNQLPEEPDD